MTDLTGKLLIAMPGMGDPRFERSVVFLCAHSEEGAMGLIVNKPADDLTLAELLEQLKIGSGDPSDAAPARGKVHFGGPVEHARGFVLHSLDYTSSESTLRVGEDYGMTATLDILEDIASGRGPDRSIMALGYAGWGPGQLEDEIAQNGWLTGDPTPEIVFDRDDGLKWAAALNALGVDPVLLSGSAGRA